MNEYLTFNKMITPVIIQILFWIGVVVCVVGALIGMFAGAGFIKSLIFLILGPLFVRVYCEILIIIFRINDSLNEIKAKK